MRPMSLRPFFHEANFKFANLSAEIETLDQMANYCNPFRHSLFIVYLLVASALLLSSPVLAKSRRPVTDSEIRQKKLDCYADIESGLWGRQCKSSLIAKENCALRCLSPTCYELIYESDPLEEGEKDFVRSQEFKYCMHKLSLGESLEDIRGSFDY